MCALNGAVRAGPRPPAASSSSVLALGDPPQCGPRAVRERRGLRIAIAGFGLSRMFELSFLMLLVSGAADRFSVVTRQSLVQLDTPDAMRGRVSAVNSIFIGASNQLGEFESGATAALVGPVASVVAGGIGTLLVAALWMRLFPSLARRETLAGDAACRSS